MGPRQLRTGPGASRSKMKSQQKLPKSIKENFNKKMREADKNIKRFTKGKV